MSSDTKTSNYIPIWQEKIPDHLPKNFCYFPFMALYLAYHKISQSGAEWITVAACCEQKTTAVQIKQGDYEGIYRVMESLRKQFLNKERPESCNRCWKMEEDGLRSKRLSYNDEMRDIDSHIEDPKFRVMDVEFETKCNSACRMCQSGNSTLWEKESLKIKSDPPTNSAGQTIEIGKRMMWNEYGHSPNTQGPKDTFLEFVLKHLPEVRQFEIEGGEPLLHDNFYKLLDKIQPHQKLTITTNGSVDTVRAISKRENTVVNVSVDGHDEVFEYIRWPLKYKRVKGNALKVPLHNLAQISVCLTSYNLFSLAHICNDFPTRKIRLGATLAGNAYQAIDYLTPEIIQEAIHYFKENVNYNNVWVTEIIEVLNKKKRACENTSDKLKRRERMMLKLSTVELDRHRGQDYHNHLHPTISKFIDEIK